MRPVTLRYTIAEGEFCQRKQWSAWLTANVNIVLTDGQMDTRINTVILMYYQ